jgi:hypothetical protein
MAMRFGGAGVPRLAHMAATMIFARQCPALVAAVRRWLSPAHVSTMTRSAS